MKALNWGDTLPFLPRWTCPSAASTVASAWGSTSCRCAEQIRYSMGEVMVPETWMSFVDWAGQGRAGHEIQAVS